MIRRAAVSKAPLCYSTFVGCCSTSSTCGPQQRQGFLFLNNNEIINLQGQGLTGTQCRRLRSVPKPETFEHVVFPPDGGGPLKAMPKIPTFNPDLGEEEKKVTKRMIEVRGPEQVHTSLWHKQFGIVATAGGLLRPDHFDMIREVVNRHMNPKRFAVWRVEEPWLPKVKKRAGARMGGGRGSIHHYSTPVRAGRVILEIGGHITFVEAQTFLPDIAGKLPFDAQFVTQEMMEEKQERLEEIRRKNINPYSWDFVLKWNMQNCSFWLSKYDFVWRGKYK